MFQPRPLAAQSSPPLPATLECAWLVSSSLAIRRACYGSSCFSRAVPHAAQPRGCLPRWGTPCNWLRWSLWERGLVHTKTSWSKLCFLAKCFHLAVLPAQLVTLLPDVHAAKCQGADGGSTIWLLLRSFPGWSWGNCWNKGWHCLEVPRLESL